MPVNPGPYTTEYQFITPQTNDQHARIRFNGNFRGEPVSWIADIMTLQYYFDHFSRANPIPAGARQFIDIRSGEQTGQYLLTVGLASKQIDHPTLLKTIIMIRNYKLLNVGCHEYGETVPVTDG